MKWLLFLTLVLWFYVALFVLSRRRRRVQERIGVAVAGKQAVPVPAAKRIKVGQIRAVSRKLATGWLKKWSQTRIEQAQLRLAQAGYPGGWSVSEWMGLRFLLMALGAGAGGVLMWVANRPMFGLLMWVALIMLGWIGPDFWLSRLTRLRQGELLKQLPSALDLLTVSVEAGLGFDQAMSRVAEKLKGSLADEFERALREIQLGSQRMVALQRMSARTGVDAIRAFVSAVVQAEKLGVGMAQVLRVQAAEVRRKRRMDAEERAMKAPVKMLFPLVAFVFPSLFVIILGPALIHIMDMFASNP